ncbi:hypothetical protein IMZ08_17695 [Bacillus luteolus]|uniref:Phage capsid protein n=1 Tax=Litchfieldia luteola TaxID=682179 RepID=A0ABR9QMZ9_9BACI|nr:DUF6366 family protein [Cytobacillus luteolus]MBE4909872.1 hypothetical protein [Cytobacillus luteolus]MBP1942578.1 hypothetical protein [Cytobacillus luteolus]
MNKEKQTPEQRREDLRRKELNNPPSSLRGSNLSDLVGSLGWRGTGILIILVVLGVIIYAVFFANGG